MSRPRHRLPRGGNHCDFCGVPEVQALYACHNFDWDGAPIFKTPPGRWAACVMCARLVDAPDWDQLNRRVMREVRKRKGIRPEELSALRVSLKGLHITFAANLDGDGNALRVLFPHVRRFFVDAT